MGLISVETMGNRPENGSNHGRKTDGQKAIRTRLARAAAVLDVALALHDVYMYRNAHWLCKSLDKNAVDQVRNLHQNSSLEMCEWSAARQVGRVEFWSQ